MPYVPSATTANANAESPIIAATTGKQADTCFKQAAAMASRSPELRELVHQSGNDPHIIALHTDDLGRVSKMARDAASEDGAMVSAGIDLFAVGRVLGHADHKSTMRYSHLANDTLMAAVEAGAAGLKLDWAQTD